MMIEMQQLEVEGRRLTVFLPPSYALSGRRYPVVYLHDGAKLMMSTLNYMYRLFREGLLAEVIVVGVESEARNDEYTPWPANAATEGKEPFGGLGANYVNELADVIKPEIDRLFRTVQDARSTGLVGYSLGGLITLYAAFRRPDAFGNFGMLSPSTWYEGMLEYVEQHSLQNREIRMYISLGNREGIYKSNIQQNAVANTLQVHHRLSEQLQETSRLRLDILDDATHDLVFMARQFPEALRWMYGHEDRKVPIKPNEISRGIAHKGDAIVTGASPALPGTETWDIRSMRNGMLYRIFVHLPLKPPPPEGYPVLYTVDGNAYFASLNDAMRLQTRHPKGLPSGLIVAVGYPEDGPFVAERRFRDLTIPDRQQGLRPDGSSWPVNGGADTFLDFIEFELMPQIEGRYAVDTRQQALFGHSLGGFFTLYTLMRRNHLFQNYVAGSPSIWWKDRVLFDMLPEFETRLRNSRLECSLMIGIGGEDTKLLANAKQFYDRLAPYEGSSIQRLRHHVFEDEGHMSVLQPMFSPMLRFVFAKEGERLCI